MENIVGIHRIPAMAGNPQKNLDFRAGVLGGGLKLPLGLEASRAQIEAALPKLAHPGAEVRA